MHTDIIGLDNILLPVWHQAIIWTNTDLLLLKKAAILSKPQWPERLGCYWLIHWAKWHHMATEICVNLGSVETLKMIYLKFHSNLPGANELMWSLDNCMSHYIRWTVNRLVDKVEPLSTLTWQDAFIYYIITYCGSVLHYDLCQHLVLGMDQYGLSQWEKVLHSNAFCHWLSPYCSMGSSNERRRYIVTLSLIGWAHTEKDPW